VLRVFAPSDDAEVCRVLKAGAWYLEVSPAPGHLWQLREQLYDRPREHPQARSEILGMAPVSRQVLEYTLPLNPELLADIVAMTPFAHRGHREKREGLRRASLAELRMAFSLKLFQRAQ
jgi:23S rRNA (guanine745-N1)-methyltransferase